MCLVHGHTGPLGGLLRYLNISTVPKAMDLVTNYFDESQLLPKTKLALEEILGRD